MKLPLRWRQRKKLCVRHWVVHVIFLLHGIDVVHVIFAVLGRGHEKSHKCPNRSAIPFFFLPIFDFSSDCPATMAATTDEDSTMTSLSLKKTLSTPDEGIDTIMGDLAAANDD